MFTCEGPNEPIKVGRANPRRRMARVRGGRRFAGTAAALLLIAGSTVSGAAGSADSQASKETVRTLSAALKDVEAVRDQLVGKLEERLKTDAKQGDAQDFRLRFNEGADRQELQMVLQQRGGKWLTAYAVVPAWRHQTFADKYQQWLRNGTSGAKRDTWRFPVSVSGLKYAAGTVSGQAEAALRLNQIEEERMPAAPPYVFHTGERHTLFDKFQQLFFDKLRRQNYAIDAKVLEDVYDFTLVMQGAAPNKSPIHLTFQVPARPWVETEATAPNWNTGVHTVDASGLTIKNGKVSGTLAVILNPDPWVPKDRKSRRVSYQFEGALDGGVFRGRHEGKFEGTDLSGDVSGSGGRVVEGLYKSEGDMGAYASRIRGQSLPVRTDVSALLASPRAAVPDDPTRAAHELIAAIQKAYGQVRALHLALRQYPLPIDEAVRQVELPAANWGEKGEEPLTAPQVQGMLALAADIRGLTEGLIEGLARPPEYSKGSQPLSDRTFGPFGGSAPLAGGDGKPYALPADLSDRGPQKWVHIPKWQVAGPFSAPDDMDLNSAELPDIVPAAEAAYPVLTGRIPRGKDEKAPAGLGWRDMDAPAGKLQFPWGGDHDRRRFGGSVTFACATLDSDRDQEVWASFAALDHGKLWVNGRLAWVLDEMPFAHTTEREALTRIALRKGVNRLLIRCREDRHTTWMRFHVCVQGGPASVEEIAEASQPDRAEPQPPAGAGGEPPLAWDLTNGVNVAWKAALPPGRLSRLAPVGDRLFFCIEPETLCCWDAKTGQELWRKGLGFADVLDAASRKAFDALASDADRTRWLAAQGIDPASARSAIASDGDRVWVHHGTGVLAAYGRDGARAWAVGSPLRGGVSLHLVDGAVIADGAGAGRTHAIVCADAATGEVKWKADAADKPNVSAVMRLRNGKHKVVALLSGEQVFDVTSGKILLNGLDVDHMGGDVVAANDIVYYLSMHRRYAVRFFLDKEGQVGHRFLWQQQIPVKLYMPTFGAVLGDSLAVITPVEEHRPGHSPVSNQEMLLYDRFTGEQTGRLRPVVHCSLPQELQAAGRYFFAFHPDTELVTLSPRPTLHVAARCPLPAGARPMVDGGRLYLQQEGGLTCVVAADTKESLACEARAMARTVEEAVGSPPVPVRLPTPKPLAAPPPVGKAPVADLGNGRLHELTSTPGVIAWLAAAGFPAPTPEQDAALASLVRTFTAQVGTELEVGGVKKALAPLPADASQISMYSYAYHYLEGLGMHCMGLTKVVFPAVLAGDATNRTSFLYTVLETPRRRTVSLMVDSPGVDVWVGGEPVEPSARARLVPGCHPVFVRIRPEFFASDSKALSIAFEVVDDPIDVRTAWAGRVAVYESELDRIIAALPGTDAEQDAADALTGAEEYRAEADLRHLVRWSRNDGSGRFPGARPPAPMEKGGNLQWTAVLPAAGGPAPVASGAHVFVGVDPGTLVCLSAADGKPVWSAELDARATAVSAPAATKDGVCAAALPETVRWFDLKGAPVWSAKAAAKSAAQAAPFVCALGDLVVAQLGAMHAVDRRTGEVRWTVEFRGKGPYGEPAHAIVGGEDVMAACDGRIIRAADGAVLCEGLPESGRFPPAFVPGLLLVPAGDAVAAFQIPARLKPGTRLLPAWQARLGADPAAAPIAYDGLAYALAGNLDLLAFDTATGEPAYRQKLGERKGAPAPEIVLGGRRLYVTNVGADSRTLILRTGRQFGRAWEYGVAGGCGAPFFLGRNAYIRSGTALYCVGGTPPQRPPKPDLSIQAAALESAPAAGTPLVPFKDNRMPMQWLIAGPFLPGSTETDFLQGIGGRDKARPEPGTKVKHQDAEIAFSPLDPKFVWRHAKFTAGMDAVDLRTAMQGKDQSTVYLYTVLDNDEDRYADLQFLTPGGSLWNTKDILNVAAWIGGKAVGEGEIVHLPRGRIPVMLQAAMGQLKKSGKIWMAPRFLDHTDVFAARKDKFERLNKSWEAYSEAKDELFVLQP